jgi:hypothetical protein
MFDLEPEFKESLIEEKNIKLRVTPNKKAEVEDESEPDTPCSEGNKISK